MKRRAFLSILISFVMIISVFATSCNSAPKTIEEYVQKNSESMEEVQKAADTAGLTVAFSGNDVIYTYDMSQIDGVTEDVIKSDIMIEQLSSALDSNADTFVSLCKQLEEESKIEGVQIVINYTFGEEEIIKKTYNSSGEVK